MSLLGSMQEDECNITNDNDTVMEEEPSCSSKGIFVILFLLTLHLLDASTSSSQALLTSANPITGKHCFYV